MADPQTLQAVVTTLPELAGNQPIQKIALFSLDGTPWPGVITPDAGAYYTLSVLLGVLQGTIDDLVARQAELETAMEEYQTNQIKLLVGEEPVPTGLKNGTLIGRLTTAP